MNIISDYPPNYSEIVAVFPTAKQRGVIFTYGDTLYNPSRVSISESLMAHEVVHSIRHGTDPKSWWDKYLVDPKFRLKEEALAHQVEYRRASQDASRPIRRQALAQIAKRLCSPLYGGLLSYDEAKKMVQGTEADIDAFLATVH